MNELTLPDVKDHDQVVYPPFLNFVSSPVTNPSALGVIFTSSDLVAESGKTAIVDGNFYHNKPAPDGSWP